MARVIDFNKPDEWTEDDLTYLRDRPERIPEEHRARVLSPVTTPSAVGESTELATLRVFLERNFADEMNVEGETPVGTAMRLLSDIAPEDINEDQGEEDDYDTWSVADLRSEITTRQGSGRSIAVDDVAKVRKADAVAALRADDLAE